MASAVEAYRADADIVIAAAAVSDFAPTQQLDAKMKRRDMVDQDFILHLKRTPDILKLAGRDRKAGQVIVGFALEDAELVERARAKLVEKQCDLVVANQTSDDAPVFGEDENTITLVTDDGVKEYPTLTKRECAVEIFNAIEELLPGQQGISGTRSDESPASDASR
jgi:phosphopantothenoylcysteine decarboxylase/phosphopantothenate--cysteine ligase